MILFRLVFRAIGKLLTWAFRPVLWLMEQRSPRQLLIDAYGLEGVGTILESSVYQGHGWHANDPCFNGRYQVIDRRGRTHLFSFSRFCFDYNDYADAPTAWRQMQAMFAPGYVFRVRYFSWLPRLHNADFHLPPITRLQGQMAKLVRNRSAFDSSLYYLQGRSKKAMEDCLAALERADGDVEKALQALMDDSADGPEQA